MLSHFPDEDGGAWTEGLSETAHGQVSGTKPGVHVGVCIYTDTDTHHFSLQRGEVNNFFSLKEYIYLLLQSKLVEDLKLKLLVTSSHV